MTYEYGSDSKLLELPNPYQLQNRLLWLCGALLVAAGVVSLLWAKSAIEASTPGLVSIALFAQSRLTTPAATSSAPHSQSRRFCSW